MASTSTPDPLPPEGGPGPSPGRGRALAELVAFLPDVVRLLWALARDPRVPRRAKLAAGGALAYVVSPIDVVPDVLPVIGRADDLWLLSRALRYLVRTAGYDLVRDLWSGSDDGFALVLVVAGVRR